MISSGSSDAPAESGHRQPSQHVLSLPDSCAAASTILNRLFVGEFLKIPRHVGVAGVTPKVSKPGPHALIAAEQFIKSLLRQLVEQRLRLF